MLELKVVLQASLDRMEPFLTAALRLRIPSNWCRGLLIRGGDILEEASHVRTIVFDKTGTLTEGRPRVQSVLAASPQLPEGRLLALAAALVTSGGRVGQYTRVQTSPSTHRYSHNAIFASSTSLIIF